MSNVLQPVIDRLARVRDTGRPVNNNEILTTLIEIAEAIQALDNRTKDNYHAAMADQDTMSI